MDALVTLPAGRWALVLGPRSIHPEMLALAARLAGLGPLRVLDGGNRFNAYTISRAVRGRREVLNRITVARAFTCHQMLNLLESTPQAGIPFLVLDMLATFYDEAVSILERQRLLAACIRQLDRLSQPVSGLVSACLPKVPDRENAALVDMLEDAAGEVWYPDPPAPKLQTPRLF